MDQAKLEIDKETELSANWSRLVFFFFFFFLEVEDCDLSKK